jgi:plastocyanin
MKTKHIAIIALLLMSLFLFGCKGEEQVVSEPETPAIAQTPVDSSVVETSNVTSTVETQTIEEPILPEDAPADIDGDVTDEALIDSNETESDTTVEDDTDETSDDSIEDVTEEPVQEVTDANATEEQTADNYRVISMKDLQVYPAEMHIKPGTTVEWRNINDNLQHIIGWSGQKNAGIKPEPIKQGESWSYTFNEPKVISWFSTARPTIQGKIYIEEEEE